MWSQSLPVYEGNRDNIVGILYVKDLIGIDDDAMVQGLMRDPDVGAGSKNALIIG